MTNVGMPVSWQMGPVSSTAMSMLDKIMSNAWEDCVSGVSSLAAMDIAARTSGGRLVDVWVISSSKLPARNSISLPPQTWYFTHLPAIIPEDHSSWEWLSLTGSLSIQKTTDRPWAAVSVSIENGYLGFVRAAACNEFQMRKGPP